MPIHPEPDAFVANVDAALVKKVFNIPKRERKSDIHQYGELDDFGRCFEVAERILGHFPRLIARIAYLKFDSADNASHLKSGSTDNTLMLIRVQQFPCRT